MEVRNERAADFKQDLHKVSQNIFSLEKNRIVRVMIRLQCKLLYQEGHTLSKIAEIQGVSIEMVKYYVYFIWGLKGRKAGQKRKVIPEDKKIIIRFLKSCLYTEKEISKEVGIKTVFVKRVIEET